MKAIYSFLLAALLLLSGCFDKQGRLDEDGHIFEPPPAGTALFPTAVDPALLPQPGAEEPIVRIISGHQLSSMAEAEELLADSRPPLADLSQNIELLALKEIHLGQACGLLTEMCGFNVVATSKAAEQAVSVFVQNLPLRQCLETICRLNGLWYREDQRIITLMTMAEYSDELVVHRNEKSRAFLLRYSNANDMAKVIQAVMGSQVEFVDIGSEKVYGHVEEEKEGSLRIPSDADRQLSDEEKEKLIKLGLIKKGSDDTEQLLERLGQEVPAVITVFKRNNSILARSMDESILEEIGRIIEAMDTPTNQVLLEISLLQLTLGEGFESFFNVSLPGRIETSTPDHILQNDGTISSRAINYFSNVAGAAMGGSALSANTLNLEFGGHDIQARMELFARDDRLEILATPFLMSANNAKVEFFVGEETPLRQGVTSKVLYNNDGFQTTAFFDVEVKKEELGTDLEISSFINEDGTITMELEAEISFAKFGVTTINAVNGVTGEIVPFEVDAIDRSELNSVITAVDGQPIAIGGIIKENLSESEKKVPILGDIPLLGFFFREVADSTQKTETVILLTPHIIRHPALAYQKSRDFMNRRSSHPRFTREQENILDFPTANLPGEQEVETDKP